jgi:hypothetical protein
LKANARGPSSPGGHGPGAEASGGGALPNSGGVTSVLAVPTRKPAAADAGAANASAPSSHAAQITFPRTGETYRVTTGTRTGSVV